MSVAESLEDWVDYFLESPRRLTVILRRRGARLPSTFQALRFMFFGAVAFWGPCLLGHYWSGRPFDPAHASDKFLNMIAPFGLLLVVNFFMSRGYRPALGFDWVTPLNLLGVWLAGPVAITGATSFAGAGFNAGPAWVSMEVALQTLAFPISTYVMARPTGTLLTLTLTSVYLIAQTWAGWPRKARRR